MPKKLRKIIKPKVRVLAAVIMLTAAAICTMKAPAVSAASCPDVKIIFARGSGGERWTDQNYLAFKNEIENKMTFDGVTYEFLDLDYPAIGIGALDVLVGTYAGAGDSYEFGKSVDTGVRNLMAEINGGTCAETKYVIAGYSQGAMVVSRAIHSLNPDKIIFAATIGDPKIYLPEGKAWFGSSLFGVGKNYLKTGAIPAACKNENLSEYRAYVPDCYAYEGLLGSYQPYQPEGYSKKLGTWCNKYDIFCSSYFSVSSHTAYVSEHIYDDVGKVIVNKIADTFDVEGQYVSAHDTVFLIDSTGSMENIINKYIKEALRLAKETLDAGGRVALYDFKDVRQGYYPNLHCGFDDCTYEIFESKLNAVRAENIKDGGDWPESDLNAALTAMNELEWRVGATKSLVILTDASYHNPDLDGTTLDQVVALSKMIDPVNIYVITRGDVVSYYEEMTERTDGRVAVIGVDEISLTDYIVARYDSLPRVEDWGYGDEDVPEIEVTRVVDDGDNVRVEFESSGGRALVILNEAILGICEDDFVIVGDLERGRENTLRLVALSETRRGEMVDVVIEALDEPELEFVPKAPDTGRM